MIVDSHEKAIENIKGQLIGFSGTSSEKNFGQRLSLPDAESMLYVKSRWNCLWNELTK